MSDKPSYWGKIFSITESPNTLRRKLQDIWRKLGPFYSDFKDLEAYVGTLPIAGDLVALEAYIKGLPAYGGVWRLKTGVALPVPVTTDWSVIPGFTENRPSVPKKVNVDFTTGSVEITETGVYKVDVSLVFQGPVGRVVEVNVGKDGVPPEFAGVDLELPANNRDVLLTYVTCLSLTDAPAVYQLYWRVDTPATIDFNMGGWSLHRIDYNNPAMVDQKIM